MEESLTAIGKKALLINGDLRKGAAPETVHEHVERVKGPTKGQHAADILAGAEFAKQIAEAKSANDYVILDSPALNQYADAYQLAQFADATLYVVKAGKTQKSDLEALATDKNLPNPMLVLIKK